MGVQVRFALSDAHPLTLDLGEQREAEELTC
jgi:hypothetical protein